MPSFMCQFMWYGMPRLNSISGCARGCFWVRSVTELADWADCPLQCGGASSNPLRAWTDAEGRGRGPLLSLLDSWARTSAFSCPRWALTLRALRSSERPCHQLSQVCGFQMAGCQTFQDPLTLGQFLPINHIYVCISHWFCLSRELSDTWS